jgi:hypothetical protein
LRDFIEFSFYGERDIMREISRRMDSSRKSGKTGREGGILLWACPDPKNPSGFRLGRVTGSIL